MPLVTLLEASHLWGELRSWGSSKGASGRWFESPKGLGDWDHSEPLPVVDAFIHSFCPLIIQLVF